MALKAADNAVRIAADATDDATASKAVRVCRNVLNQTREIKDNGGSYPREQVEKAVREVARRIVKLQEHSLLRRALVYVRIEDEAEERAEERLREKYPDVPRWEISPEAVERTKLTERLTLLIKLSKDNQRRYRKLAKEKHVELYANAARDLAEAERIMKNIRGGWSGVEALEKARKWRKRSFLYRWLH